MAARQEIPVEVVVSVIGAARVEQEMDKIQDQLNAIAESRSFDLMLSPKDREAFDRLGLEVESFSKIIFPTARKAALQYARTLDALAEKSTPAVTAQLRAMSKDIQSGIRAFADFVEKNEFTTESFADSERLANAYRMANSALQESISDSSSSLQDQIKIAASGAKTIGSLQRALIESSKSMGESATAAMRLSQAYDVMTTKASLLEKLVSVQKTISAITQQHTIESERQAAALARTSDEVSTGLKAFKTLGGILSKDLSPLLERGGEKAADLGRQIMSLSTSLTQVPIDQLGRLLPILQQAPDLAKDLSSILARKDLVPAETTQALQRILGLTGQLINGINKTGIAIAGVNRLARSARTFISEAFDPSVIKIDEFARKFLPQIENAMKDSALSIRQGFKEVVQNLPKEFKAPSAQLVRVGDDMIKEFVKRFSQLPLITKEVISGRAVPLIQGLEKDFKELFGTIQIEGAGAAQKASQIIDRIIAKSAELNKQIPVRRFGEFTASANQFKTILSRVDFDRLSNNLNTLGEQARIAVGSFGETAPVQKFGSSINQVVKGLDFAGKLISKVLQSIGPDASANFNIAAANIEGFGGKFLRVLENISINTSKSLLAASDSLKDMEDSFKQIEQASDQVQLEGPRAALARFRVEIDREASIKLSKDILKAGTAFKTFENFTVAATGQFVAGQQKIIQISQEFLATFSRVTRFLSASLLLFKGFQILNFSAKQANEMEQAMARLAIVANKTKNEMVGVARRAEEIGVKFGELPSQILDTIQVFVQSGISIEESMEIAETAMKGAIVTGLQMREIADVLIAVRRTFQIEGKELAITIDQIQAVQKKFAVTSADVAKGIQILGPTVRQFGGTLEDTISLITATAEVTRKTGVETANALKVILPRAFVGRGRQFFEEIGVAVTDTAGDFRKLSDILADTRVALSSLSDEQRAAALAGLAANRRFLELSSLLRNLDRFFESNKVAAQAQGTAIKDVEIALDTLNKTIKQTQAVFIQMTNIFSANAHAIDAVRSVVEGVRDGINVMSTVFEKLAVAIGLVSPALPLLKFAAFASVIGGTTFGVIKLSNVLQKFGLFLSGAVIRLSNIISTSEIYKTVLAGTTRQLGLFTISQNKAIAATNAASLSFTTQAAKVKSLQLSLGGLFTGLGTVRGAFLTVGRLLPSLFVGWVALEAIIDVFSSTINKTTPEIEALKEEISEGMITLIRARGGYSGFIESISNLSTAIRNSEQRLSDLRTRLESISNTVVRNENEIRRLKDAIAELEQAQKSAKIVISAINEIDKSFIKAKETTKGFTVFLEDASAFWASLGDAFILEDGPRNFEKFGLRMLRIAEGITKGVANEFIAIGSATLGGIPLLGTFFNQEGHILGSKFIEGLQDGILDEEPEVVRALDAIQKDVSRLTAIKPDKITVEDIAEFDKILERIDLVAKGTGRSSEDFRELKAAVNAAKFAMLPMAEINSKVAKSFENVKIKNAAAIEQINQFAKSIGLIDSTTQGVSDLGDDFSLLFDRIEAVNKIFVDLRINEEKFSKERRETSLNVLTVLTDQIDALKNQKTLDEEIEKLQKAKLDIAKNILSVLTEELKKGIKGEQERAQFIIQTKKALEAMNLTASDITNATNKIISDFAKMDVLASAIDKGAKNIAAEFGVVNTSLEEVDNKLQSVADKAITFVDFMASAGADELSALKQRLLIQEKLVKEQTSIVGFLDKGTEEYTAQLKILESARETQKGLVNQLIQSALKTAETGASAEKWAETLQFVRQQLVQIGDLSEKQVSKILNVLQSRSVIITLKVEKEEAEKAVKSFIENTINLIEKQSSVLKTALDSLLSDQVNKFKEVKNPLEAADLRARDFFSSITQQSKEAIETSLKLVSDITEISNAFKQAGVDIQALDDTTLLSLAKAAKINREEISQFVSDFSRFSQLIAEGKLNISQLPPEFVSKLFSVDALDNFLKASQDALKAEQERRLQMISEEFEFRKSKIEELINNQFNTEIENQKLIIANKDSLIKELLNKQMEFELSNQKLILQEREALQTAILQRQFELELQNQQRIFEIRQQFETQLSRAAAERVNLSTSSPVVAPSVGESSEALNKLVVSSIKDSQKLDNINVSLNDINNGVSRLTQLMNANNQSNIALEKKNQDLQQILNASRSDTASMIAEIKQLRLDTFKGFNSENTLTQSLLSKLEQNNRSLENIKNEIRVADAGRTLSPLLNSMLQENRKIVNLIKEA